MKFIYKILFLCLISSSFQILFGQNYRELQKLQNEYQKVLEREAIQKPSEITDAENTAKSMLETVFAVESSTILAPKAY